MSAALTGSLALGSLIANSTASIAASETRSISLFHNRTGENLTVTYMKDGNYVPSAMKQINYLLRDWRRNEVITIDPRMIDLVWELHEDLGSKQPVRIVCGYRSGKTNSFLRRIGRRVAEKSQHIKGKAIDFYFTDVPTIRVRNSALVRRVGGVGYYTGPSGFLHVDSGSVRQWGPKISDYQMAQIFREGGKKLDYQLGKNINQKHIEPEKTRGGLVALLSNFGKRKAQLSTANDLVVEKKIASDEPVEVGYAGDEQDLADLSADASSEPTKGKKLPSPVLSSDVVNNQMASLANLSQAASVAPKTALTRKPTETTKDNSVEPVIKVNPTPRPRLKPIGTQKLVADATTDKKLIRITAASAPPSSQSIGKDPSPISDSLGVIIESVALKEHSPIEVQTTNKKGKGNFTLELRNGTATEVPMIKPMSASVGGRGVGLLSALGLDLEASIRRDGAPTLIDVADETSLPVAFKVKLENADTLAGEQSAEGKGDLLIVNREGKGDLE